MPLPRPSSALTTRPLSNISGRNLYYPFSSNFSLHRPTGLANCRSPALIPPSEFRLETSRNPWGPKAHCSGEHDKDLHRQRPGSLEQVSMRLRCGELRKTKPSWASSLNQCLHPLSNVIEGSPWPASMCTAFGFGGIC